MNTKCVAMATSILEQKSTCSDITKVLMVAGQPFSRASKRLMGTFKDNS
uniref:Uncharacterized protein n=1 Tax=Anguilla anguilla TaxID=7936 RepID=A0A0E9VZT3_ANGAN